MRVSELPQPNESLIYSIYPNSVHFFHKPEVAFIQNATKTRVKLSFEPEEKKYTGLWFKQSPEACVPFALANSIQAMGKKIDYEHFSKLSFFAKTRQENNGVSFNELIDSVMYS